MTQTREIQLLGTITIIYNERGEAISIAYVPKIEVSIEDLDQSSISTLKYSKNNKDIEEQAKIVFSTWLSKIVNVELIDLTKWQIKAEVKSCNELSDGEISCKLDLYMVKIG